MGQPSDQGRLLSSANAVQASPAIKPPPVSAPALHTARTILLNWELTPKRVSGRNPETIPATENNVSLVVDVCTNVFRFVEWKEKTAELFTKVCENRATVDEVKKFLYDLGIVLNRLPTYRA